MANLLLNNAPQSIPDSNKVVYLIVLTAFTMDMVTQSQQIGYLVTQIQKCTMMVKMDYYGQR